MTLNFELIASFSLKDKRRLRQSLIDRLKGRFNISIVESGLQDDYRSLEISLAYVALSETLARQIQTRIEDSILSILAGQAELLDTDYEII